MDVIILDKKRERFHEIHDGHFIFAVHHDLYIKTDTLFEYFSRTQGNAIALSVRAHFFGIRGDGVSADTFVHGIARIITILLDDSSSIETNGNTEHLIDGHNQIIEGLRGSSKKQQLETIVSCRTLNNGPVYEYKHLADVPKLTRTNFSPDGSTPLFDQSIVTIGGVIIKVQEFENAGIAAGLATAAPGSSASGLLD